MADVKLRRYRNLPFTVNWINDQGMMKSYEWSGSKNGKYDTKPVPEELISYLVMNTIVFTDGELAIIEDNDEGKQLSDSLDENYKNNTHSKEEVIKILEGNFMKMKAEVSKITNKQEISYFIDVAKEIKLDSNSKLAFLADLIGVPFDILFSVD